MTPTNYADDLAFVHDVGFTNYIRAATPFLLTQVRAASTHGTVVDLGCGTGVWCQTLADEGFDALGIDLSPGMIERARAHAPGPRFQCASFLDADLPPCHAVTAIGEVLNYMHDERAGARGALEALAQRVHAALEPAGVFIFDLAGPGRCPEGASRKHWVEDEWAMCQAVAESERKLTRSLTVFRKLPAGDYRRTDEVHTLRLYPRGEVVAMLTGAGFATVEALDGYGQVTIPPGMSVFIARKAA